VGSKYFSESEFKCKCPGYCKDEVTIDMTLVKYLDELRANVGPISISSGVRCRKWNDQIGGVKYSQHLKGLAVDIRVRSSVHRRLLLSHIAPNFKFTGVGVGENFIHVDIREATVGIAWTY